MNYSINLSIFNNNSSAIKEVCEINQYKCLESVANFPKVAFYLLLASFSFLFIYTLVSAHIKNIEFKQHLQERIMNSSLLLTTSALYFTTLLVFPQQRTGAIMQTIGFILAGLMATSIYFQRVKRK